MRARKIHRGAPLVVGEVDCVYVTENWLRDTFDTRWFNGIKSSGSLWHEVKVPSELNLQIESLACKKAVCGADGEFIDKQCVWLGKRADGAIKCVPTSTLSPPPAP